MLAILKHNLSNLLRFSGRTGPKTFWLYATAVLLVEMAGMMLALVPMVTGTFARVNRFIREHPDQVEVQHYPGGTSWQIHGNHPELMPDFGMFLLLMGISMAVSALLLAAAVTRRLHDSNRRGWWGLPPLLLLGFGLALMQNLMSRVGQDVDEPGIALIFLLFFNNLAYLGTLGALVVLLALKGTDGPNRFGERLA